MTLTRTASGRTAVGRPPPQLQVGLLGGLAAAGGLVAGAAVLSPARTIAVLLVLLLAVAVLRYPVSALIALLLIEPFHGALFQYATFRVGVDVGAVSLWKDALIVALFARGLIERLWRRDGWFPLLPVDLVFLGYVAFYTLLMLTSPDLHDAGYALARDVEGTVLFFAIMLLRPSRMAVLLCIAAILVAACTIGAGALYEQYSAKGAFQTTFGFPSPAPGSSFLVGSTGYRSGSFLGSPLFTAFYLAAAAAAALGAAVAVRGVPRLLAAGAAALIAAGLTVTYTRSGYAGAAVGGFLALALAIRNARIRVAITGLLLVSSSWILLTALNGGNTPLTRSSEENTSKIQALQTDLDVITINPLGNGLGSVDVVQQRFHPGQQVPTSESTYAAKAIEAGIAGGGLYILVLLVLLLRLRAVMTRASRDGDAAGRALCAGAIGTVAAVAVAGFFLGVQELMVELLLWGVPALALCYAGSMRPGTTTMPDEPLLARFPWRVP